MSSTPDRIDFIHTLRGIAPLLVLWAHLGAWWPVEHGIVWDVHTASIAWIMIPLKIYQDAGHLGVIIFFLISGYIIAHVSRAERVSTFLARRFFRIFPLMAVAISLSIGVSLLMAKANLPPSIGVQSTSPLDGLGNLLLLPWIAGTPYALSVTWTLFVELLFYVLVALVLPVSTRSPVAATVFMLAISTAIAAGVILSVLPSFASPVIYLPILICGRCIYFARKYFHWHWVTLAVACWLIFLVLFELLSPGLLLGGPTPPIYTYIYAMLAFLGAMYLNIKPKWAFLGFFADTSYSLYLLHLPVGSLLLGLAISAELPFGVAAAITAPVLFGICWCSWTLIEKPTANLGRKFSTRLAVKP